MIKVYWPLHPDQKEVIAAKITASVPLDSPCVRLQGQLEKSPDAEGRPRCLHPAFVLLLLQSCWNVLHHLLVQV